MKKMAFIFFVVVSVFLIYILTMDRKIYYLSLGDYHQYDSSFDYSYYVSNYLNRKRVLESYVHDFCVYDKRITDIINDIKNNSLINNHTLKNSLIRADLVTIKISQRDIFDRLKFGITDSIYDYIDDLSDDFEELIVLIRKYCKEKVLFLGYTIPSDSNSEDADVIIYLNRKYKRICEKYDVFFVDLDVSGARKISDKIIKVLNK